MQKSEKKYPLVLIAGPSGSGKTTLIKSIVDKDCRFCKCIATTTRDKRPGEIEGKDYFFTDKASFLRMQDKGELMEPIEYANNFYSHTKAFINKSIEENKIPILDATIDWYRKTKNLNEFNIVDIFIKPSSMDVLKERLSKRGSQSSAETNKRLEIAKKEIANSKEFSYVVVNDDLEKAVQEILDIIK
jgi:guanylate kinase